MIKGIFSWNLNIKCRELEKDEIEKILRGQIMKIFDCFLGNLVFNLYVINSESLNSFEQRSHMPYMQFRTWRKCEFYEGVTWIISTWAKRLLKIRERERDNGNHSQNREGRDAEKRMDGIVIIISEKEKLNETCFTIRNEDVLKGRCFR